MTSEGPCHYCGTTQIDRIPVLVLNKVTGRLDDMYPVCKNCWDKVLKRNVWDFNKYYEAWYGKPKPSNPYNNSGSSFWSI